MLRLSLRISIGLLCSLCVAACSGGNTEPGGATPAAAPNTPAPTEQANANTPNLPSSVVETPAVSPNRAPTDPPPPTSQTSAEGGPAAITTVPTTTEPSILPSTTPALVDSSDTVTPVPSPAESASATPLPTESTPAPVPSASASVTPLPTPSTPAPSESASATPLPETPTPSPSESVSPTPLPTESTPAPSPSASASPTPSTPAPALPAFLRTLSTIAGKAGGCGYASGTGDTARFGAPDQIAADGKTLYVADGLGQIFRVTVDPATGAHTSQRIAALQYLYESSPGNAQLKRADVRDLLPIGNSLYVLTSNYGWEPQGSQLWKLPLSTGALLTALPSTPLQLFQGARAIVNIEGVVHVIGWNDETGLALFAIQDADGTTTKVRDLTDINPYGAAYSPVTKKLYLPSQPGGSGTTNQGRVWSVDMANPEHPIEPLPNLVLNYPNNVSVSPSGTELLILDSYATKTLTRYNLTEHTATLALAGGPKAVDGPLDGTARLGTTRAVFALDNGQYYLGSDCTLRLSDNTQIRAVAGSQATTAFVNGPGDTARLYQPEHIVASPDGTMLYAIDHDPGDKLLRRTLRQIALAETAGGPTATILPNPLLLVDAAGGTVVAEEMAIIPNTDTPRLFVVTNKGALYYVNVTARRLYRINLKTADGQSIIFGKIAFDSAGRLLSAGALVSPGVARTDILVTGLGTATLDAAAEFTPTAGGPVTVTEFNLDPEHHLVRGYRYATLYNPIADTFLITSSNNAEFKLMETGDPQHPYTAQWKHAWRCEDFASQDSPTRSAAFGPDGLYRLARPGPLSPTNLVVNQCRSDDQTDAVVTVAGNSEQGVKDGLGPLGGMNTPTDFVFDGAHQRFYILDPAEHVLRVLQ